MIGNFFRPSRITDRRVCSRGPLTLVAVDAVEDVRAGQCRCGPLCREGSRSTGATCAGGLSKMSLAPILLALGSASLCRQDRCLIHLKVTSLSNYPQQPLAAAYAWVLWGSALAVRRTLLPASPRFSAAAPHGRTPRGATTLLHKQGGRIKGRIRRTLDRDVSTCFFINSQVGVWAETGRSSTPNSQPSSRSTKTNYNSRT